MKAREKIKQVDKELANLQHDLVVACFDLEEVLLAPRALNPVYTTGDGLTRLISLYIILEQKMGTVMCGMRPFQKGEPMK